MKESKKKGGRHVKADKKAKGAMMKINNTRGKASKK